MIHPSWSCPTEDVVPSPQSTTKKSEVIEETLLRLGMTEKREQVIMVGDKSHDILGAKETGVKSIGVLYGYGTREEIENAAPDGIAETVGELKKTLCDISVS